jgi:integrase
VILADTSCGSTFCSACNSVARLVPFSMIIAWLGLANINNAAMKQLVAKMGAAKLSAKTIINYTGLVKLIVASAKSEEGEPLFPRKWDSEFIDLPIVKDQRQPKFSAETMSAIVQNTSGQYRVLYALLAGSGLRIGEALGLEVAHISKDSYDRSREDTAYRQDVTFSVGTGFTVPTALAVVSVRKVRKNREEVEAENVEIACPA